MEVNRAAFGALAVLGVVAAGGGAYLANRHNDTALQPVALYEAPAANAVTETENSIATTPAATVEAAPLAAPEPAPEPSRRTSVARKAPAAVRPTPPASQRTPTASTSTGSASPRSGSSSSPAYTPSTSVESPVAAAVEPVENTTVERTPVAPEPPRKIYDELVIPADSVIGLQVETAVSSQQAK